MTETTLIAAAVVAGVCALAIIVGAVAVLGLVIGAHVALRARTGESHILPTPALEKFLRDLVKPPTPPAEPDKSKTEQLEF